MASFHMLCRHAGTACPELIPVPPLILPVTHREAPLRNIAAPVRYRLLPRFVLDTVWGERMKGRQGPFPRPQRVPASGSSRPFLSSRRPKPLPSRFSRPFCIAAPKRA